MRERIFPELKSCRFGTFIFLFVAAQQFIAPAHAGLYMDSDCHALRLETASGVPQDKIHEYKFSGTCNINAVKSSGPVVLRTVPASASAHWDATKKEFTETFHLLADAYVEGHVSEGSSTLNYGSTITSGIVSSTFKCNDDPLIAQTPCFATSHVNQSGFQPFSNPAQKLNRPLLKGKTTLAEASSLSKQAASEPPPAQAPVTAGKALTSPGKQQSTGTGIGILTQGAAPGSGLTRRSGPVRVMLEGEDFVKAGKFLAAGSKVDVQPMGGSETGWSGNAQLLWGGAPGAVLDLLVDIPEPGKYAVELYMTRAPDYANLKLEVDGKPSVVPINLFSPSVMSTGPLQAGTFSLQPGQRKLSFMIVGKYAQSKGYLVGIDRVVFSKIGPP